MITREPKCFWVPCRKLNTSWFIVAMVPPSFVMYYSTGVSCRLFLTYWDMKEQKALLPEITDCLSIRTMATAKTHIADSAGQNNGVWEKLLGILIDEPNFEWLMIDASYIKVHQGRTGTKGGNQDMERTKGSSIQRYIWPWMRMVCRSEWLSRQDRCGLYAGLQIHREI